jgi:hypothetical protein
MDVGADDPAKYGQYMGKDGYVDLSTAEVYAQQYAYADDKRQVQGPEVGGAVGTSSTQSSGMRTLALDGRHLPPSASRKAIAF